MLGVARAATRPPILLSIAVVMLYSAALVLLARQFGLWSAELTKDTIIWFVATALVLLINLPHSAQSGFFRKAAVDALKVTVLVEFFVNLFVFSLPIELILLPVAFLIVVIPVVTPREERFRLVVRFTNVVSSMVGLGIGIYVAWRLTVDWRDVANAATLQALALPIWMTLGLLPFVYVLSLIVNYGTAFARINMATDDPRARRRAKLALVTTLHARTAVAGSFVWPCVRRTVASESWGEARRIIKEYRAEHRQDKDRLRARKPKNINDDPSS